MDTIPIVKRKDEAKWGTYRTNDTIPEIYVALAAATQSGQACQTRLNPPHADPRVAHPPIYGRFFLFVRQLEAAFDSNSQGNFQHIVTTTEPLPEKLQTAPSLIKAVLNASTKDGGLLKVDL